MSKAVYADNSESRYLLNCIEWAEKALAQEPIIYPNGKDSHEVANATIDECEDKLLDHLRIIVTPDQDVGRK